jgi:outer membrane protein insertion porin family
MTKRFVAALLGLLVARYTFAFEPFVVRDIRLEGIQRVEAGTVFSYLPVKVGETMTDEKAAQAIRTLFATSLFRDVRIEVEGNVLVVVVEERPAIAQIDFVGMKEFPADQVRKALRENGISEGRTFDKAVIDQAEQEIKRQYLTRGRYGVTVTTTSPSTATGSRSTSPSTREVAKIRNINIVGNRCSPGRSCSPDDAPDARLAELVPTTSTRQSSWRPQAIRSWYLNRGYLGFNISPQVSVPGQARRHHDQRRRRREVHGADCSSAASCTA